MSDRADPSLPALAFGDADAEVCTDARAYADRMAAAVVGLNAYEPVHGTAFASKSARIEFQGLRLVAGANTPVHAEVGDNDGLTLMVPLAGSNLTTVGAAGYDWNAGHAAMLMPRTARGGLSSTRSTLNLALDPARLSVTAHALLGLPQGSAIDLRLDAPRLVAMRPREDVDFDALLRHACGLIDSVGCDPVLVGRLAVDDLLYRLVVTMLRPDLFLAETAAPELPAGPEDSRRALDALCDQLMARLGERITLTDMARTAGMPARTLQFAFKTRFGCSPMQWLRSARLEMARRRFLDPHSHVRVTAMALELGFAKPSEFTRYYRQRFGELPSDTRRLRRRT